MQLSIIKFFFYLFIYFQYISTFSNLIKIFLKFGLFNPVFPFSAFFVCPDLSLSFRQLSKTGCIRFFWLHKQAFVRFLGMAVRSAPELSNSA